MRIWRIAGFAAALCAGGVSLLFGYRLFWREASSALMESGFGAFRDFLIAEVLVVLFVLAEAALECKKMKPDVYWIRDIDPLRFAMMPRPRGGEWLEDEVSGWRQMGIDIVVSLLHQYEADELEISEEERVCVSRGICYHSFPIKDRGTPESEPRFFALADELAASVKEGSVVAIHCRAGIGRSGLLAGSVLLRLGVPASQVFTVLSRARGLSVPDTPSQMEWFHSVAARMHSNNSLEGDAFKATRASS